MREAPGWALLPLALALAACAGIDNQGPDPQTVLVNIQNSAFLPETVTVARGRVVRWTNRDATLHRVVSDTSFWGSALLPNNWWFEVRFDTSGTFDYHCLADSTHVETGTVIVQ